MVSTVFLFATQQGHFDHATNLDNIMVDQKAQFRKVKDYSDIPFFD